MGCLTAVKEAFLAWKENLLFWCTTPIPGTFVSSLAASTPLSTTWGRKPWGDVTSSGDTISLCFSGSCSLCLNHCLQPCPFSSSTWKQMWEGRVWGWKGEMTRGNGCRMSQQDESCAVYLCQGLGPLQLRSLLPVAEWSWARELKEGIWSLFFSLLASFSSHMHPYFSPLHHVSTSCSACCRAVSAVVRKRRSLP